MQISRDNPFYYITFVAHNRLNIFQKDKMKDLACEALDEARNSCGFLIFAYVVMHDHIHLITDSPQDSSVILRYLKGISAKRLIDYLKENNFQSSLNKIRHKTRKGNWQHSLWQHRSNILSLISENILMEKVNYIHLNPVREKLVKIPTDYRWSSARFWKGNPSADEPLEVDCRKITWRRGKA